MNQNKDQFNNRWLVMSAVAMGIFLATIDMSIVNIALPTIVRSLGTDFSLVQWVILSYLLTVATLMLSIGRLGDIMGKKWLYLSGFIIFTLGSLFCGFAPDVYWLIGLRVFQGLGGALIMALGAAIVTEAFPHSERGKAMGIIGSIVSVGIVAGPTIGGIIVSLLSWRWIFFVNLPVGILGIYGVIRFIPQNNPSARQRFDYWGATALFVSLLCLLLGLTVGQEKGFTDTAVLQLFMIWLVGLVVFLVIEIKTEQPIIDLNLFKNRTFSLSVGTGFVTFISVSGIFIIMPFFLENVLGYNTLEMGLLMGVIPVMMGLSSPFAGHLSDRYGSRIICLIGLIVIALAFFIGASLNEETTALQYLLIFAPMGLGMGIFQAPNNSAIMGSVPPERLGVASGMLSITRTMGQTVGIALLGAIWANRSLHYAGSTFKGKTTITPASAQVAAFQDTFLLVSFLLVGATLVLFLGGDSLLKKKDKIS